MFWTFSRFFLCLPLWWIVSAQAGPELPIWAAASWRNDIDTVKAHIVDGTNIDTVDDWTGKTALHYAAEYGHLEIAKLLLAFCSLAKSPETLAKPAITWSSRSSTGPRSGAAGASFCACPGAGKERQPRARERQAEV